MSKQPDEIIVCPNCGQRNRISSLPTVQSKKPICSKCWTSLIINNEKTDIPLPPKPDIPIDEQIKNNSTSGSTFFSGRMIIGLIIFSLIGWALLQDSSAPTQKNSSATTTSLRSNTPTYPEYYLPSSGHIQNFTSAECIAPLEIRGGSGANYMVKLVNADYGNQIMTIFVRSGTTATVDVPLGNYEFKYASGEKWYGYKHLFGPTTSYSKADKIFKFVNTGYQVSGYTVTLYRVTNGNMRTTHIGASQF